MLRKCICGILTILLLPVGLAFGQPADGRLGAYPGGPDMMSRLSDASRSGNRAEAIHQGDMSTAAPYRYPYKRYAFSYQAYATGPPYWAPGYSYPYGYASSWYPYNSWRGLGNEDNAFPNYDYNAYSPIPSVYGAPMQQAYMMSRTYTGGPAYVTPSYTAPGSTRAYAAGVTSRLTVTAPRDADIYLEGVKMAPGAGDVHTFQTPPLNPGEQYRYGIRAVWTGPDGQTVDQKQEVAFAGGAGVSVRFPTGQSTRSLETRSLESR
jgi:uncharacterized protein (TIGR03000 family)